VNDLAGYLKARRDEVDERIARHLPAAMAPIPDFAGAVRDALDGSGKRVRPILVLEVASVLKRPAADVEALAVAVEFVHSASLALDDLPSMDDATLRRGKPALHKTHGEALTILAAVALLMESSAVLARGLARSRLDKEERVALLAALGATVGFDGMAAGQWADLSQMRAGADLRTIEFIHRRKTGMLFDLALSGAARLCRAAPAERAALEAYGRNLGLAFQVKDDLLDVEGDPARLGKDANADRHKTTFVDLAGRASAHALLDELIATAIASLALFGERGRRLEQLALYVRDRDA
jgi:geranylgeranyl diphosphate synthase type II